MTEKHKHGEIAKQSGQYPIVGPRKEMCMIIMADNTFGIKRI